jgi:hypothetical protein
MQMLVKRWSRASWLVLVLWTMLSLQHALAASESYRFEGVERVVAVGDIHGAYGELVTILTGTGVIDEDLAWSGGRTHLVSLGDLLDRGDHGRQVMDLLMRLGPEAAAAGGAVHVVLGNHEVMNLTGDLRYVDAGDYLQFGSEARAGLPAGYRERRAALAPDGVYGRWLMELPVAIVVNDTLFVHGGLSGRLAGLTLEQLNREVRRDVQRVARGWHTLLKEGALAEGDGFDALRVQAARLARLGDDRLRDVGKDIAEGLEGLPFLPDGPLWYRGSARCHPYEETAVAESVLESLGARRVAVGHTPTQARRITSRLDGRVLSVDTGMNHAAYRGRPAALIIEAGAARAWYAAEGDAAIEAEPHRVLGRPAGMDDAGIEAFLATAEVVRIDAPPAAGGSRTVLLERDGQRLAAVFNSKDTAPRVREGRWPRGAERSDRYSHEIAAYLVDRLIGLEMVPVTVERTIDGERGALRLEIEDSISEEVRQSQRTALRSDCELAAQFRMASVFDILIYNPDHALGTMRHDRHGQLWLVDQSKAFGPARDVRAALRSSGLKPSPQLAEALGRVTAENLESLSPYLHRRQVQALAERAAQLRATR